MARRATGTGLNADTIMDSGRTLAEEIRARTGRTARAPSSTQRFQRVNKAGEVAFGPEDIIRTEVIDKLKHGDLDNDNVYLDQLVRTGTGVDPFTRIGRMKNPQKKMQDFITFYDQADWYYMGQMNYNTTAGSNYVAPVTKRDDPNYVYTSPAPLSEVPTATSMPERPRTVAAGFVMEENETKGKMTVVFRDGTYYNYYNVDPKTWEKFKELGSKWEFIKNVLDAHERGPASDVGMEANDDVRRELYRIARAVQQVAKGRGMTERQRQTRTKGATGKGRPTPVDSYRTKKARGR